jgi:hypothetical protein
MKQIALLALIALLILSSSAAALRAFSGANVFIDTPIDDDIFASGSVVNINAPVSSATVAGGTVNINAPVAGDLIVAGGQVNVNSPIGGKVMAIGGNLNIGGNISKNALLGGGQVDIRPGTVIGRDAFVSGGTVTNAGKVSGNLSVSASKFENIGSAGRVEFKQIKTEREEPKFPVNPFSILMTLGYLVAGFILLRLFPALFTTIDSEVKRSPAAKTIIGFVILIAGIILILLVTITMVGIPLAVIMALLLIVAVMLSGIFVAFSLGRTLFDLVKFRTSDLAIFLIGFIILNGLFYIPYAGGLIKLMAVSLGFGAILYAIRDNWTALTRPS